MKGIIELTFGATSQDGEFWLTPDDLKKVVVVCRDQDDNTLFERCFDPNDVVFDEVQRDEENEELWNVTINLPIPSDYQYTGYPKFEIGFVPQIGPAWFDILE